MFPTISIMGSGWLGLPLARDLADRGYPVKLSTTTPARLEALHGPGVEPFLVDTRQPDDRLATFVDSEVLVINITSKDIDAFARLVDALENSAVRHVLFISSTSVYPDCDCEVAEDDGREDTAHPLYRIERLFAEASGFDSTVLRFSGLVGYSRHPGRFFASGRAVPNPRGFVNLIHRDDCINLIRAIIEQSAWGRVFNGCADEHPRRHEFYSHSARLAGLPEPAAGDGDRYKIISNTRIKRELGYRFVHPDPMQFTYD